MLKFFSTIYMIKNWMSRLFLESFHDQSTKKRKFEKLTNDKKFFLLPYVS